MVTLGRCSAVGPFGTLWPVSALAPPISLTQAWRSQTPSGRPSPLLPPASASGPAGTRRLPVFLRLCLPFEIWSWSSGNTVPIPPVVIPDVLTLLLLAFLFLLAND